MSLHVHVGTLCRYVQYAMSIKVSGDIVGHVAFF